jgi:hypothetical protein
MALTSVKVTKTEEATIIVVVVRKVFPKNK